MPTSFQHPRDYFFSGSKRSVFYFADFAKQDALPPFSVLRKTQTHHRSLLAFHVLHCAFLWKPNMPNYTKLAFIYYIHLNNLLFGITYKLLLFSLLHKRKYFLITRILSQ